MFGRGGGFRGGGFHAVAFVWRFAVAFVVAVLVTVITDSIMMSSLRRLRLSGVVALGYPTDITVPTITVRLLWVRLLGDPGYGYRMQPIKAFSEFAEACQEHARRFGCLCSCVDTLTELLRESSRKRFWFGLDAGFYPWDYLPYYAGDYYPYDYYTNASRR